MKTFNIALATSSNPALNTAIHHGSVVSLFNIGIFQASVLMVFGLSVYIYHTCLDIWIYYHQIVLFGLQLCTVDYLADLTAA